MILSTSSNLLGPQVPLLVTGWSLHSPVPKKCLMEDPLRLKRREYRDMVPIQKRKIKMGER